MRPVISIKTTRPAGLRRDRMSGFTLLEMLIAVLLGAMVLAGALELFDSANRVSRVQTNVTDMQQSLRAAQYDVVRLLRMAGRGPLPLRSGARQMPGGVALQVVNNVPQNTQIGFTAGSGPTVLGGTDILVIRGVFNSSLYQVNYADPATFSRTATGGTVTVASQFLVCTNRPGLSRTYANSSGRRCTRSPW